MTCVQSKSLLSAYLDGALTGRQMYSLDQHLQQCSPCNREYLSLRQTQLLLCRIGRVRAPEDLSLKLRLAISHEAARSKSPYFGTLIFHIENALRAFMVPATTGLVATVLIFGFVAGILASPPSVHANAADVPLTFGTQPELLPNSFGFSVGPVNQDALLIQAYVDSNGRVQDFRVLSGSENPQDLHELKNMLILTTFRPATWMGAPRPGTAILSFSKISVKG